MRHTMLPSFLCLMLISLATSARAEGVVTNSTEPAVVKLVEIEDSDCALKDGMMVTLSNSQLNQFVEVWVDRWYMGVQTADHTKHTFNNTNEMIPLGCSNTLSGKQHWTIHSVKILSN